MPNDQAGKFFRQPSNEGRFSNSSGSLEALSRRSSNPDAPDNLDSKRGGENTTTNSNQYVNQPNIERTRQTCACSCTGWAEIYIRRPTGNMSWIMRIQNQIITDPGSNEFPLHDLISIFMPTLGGIYNSDVFDDTKLLTNRFPTTNRSANAETFRNDMTVDDQRTGSSGSGLNIIDDSKELARKEVQEQSQEEDEEDNDDEDGDDNGDEEPQEDLLEVEVVNDRVMPAPMGETTTNLPSGPINIPKMVDKHKIPSGSFSDVEPDELDDDDEQRNDDVTFEENDTRSRNPVRRVNSSPEMSSNWRSTYTKGPLTLATNIIAGGPNAAINNNLANQIDDDLNASSGGDDSQQKKKNFGKDMRVSCEAIPEEIADSTPPNASAVEFAKMMKHDEQKPSIQAIDSIRSQHALQQQQHDFVSNKPNLQSIFLPPASLPATKHLAITTPELPLTAAHNQPPKKQHSADDALNASQNKSASEQSSGITGGKIKPNLEMTKLTTKPPQSPTPLSPRLLAKNSGSTLSAGANINDFPRGRSKTISVVRGSEMDSRGENSKWPFRGSKCINNNKLYMLLLTVFKLFSSLRN